MSNSGSGYQNISLGKIGEQFAVGYLERRDYQIIERNVYVGRSEIDIVSKKDGLYVFVEVKTRKTERYVDFVDILSDKRRERLFLIALEYLSKKQHHTEPFRIDLIGILVKGRRVVKIIHERDIV